MANFKATIIILDYLKAKQVLENVRTLFKQDVGFSFKVIIIDNSCRADNARILEALKSRENVMVNINPKNTGYTRAHNEVKHLIEGDYVLIVNPDIIWSDQGALQKMVNYLDEREDIGVLGPRQVEKSGQTAMTIRAWPKFYLQVARRSHLRYLPFLKGKVAYDEMRHLDYSQIQDVDWLQSSCMVVRKLVWDLAGGLNENYFLFMSDVEICFQSWVNGFRVVYYPEAKVVADGKRVSAGGFRKFFQSWVLRQHVRDSLRYRLNHLMAKDPRQDYYKCRKYQ